MSIRSNIATVTADLARWGLRSVLHRNGGALPGKLALSIDPELVADLAASWTQAWSSPARTARPPRRTS